MAGKDNSKTATHGKVRKEGLNKINTETRKDPLKKAH